MEVQFTPDQKAFVQQAIQSGRIDSAEAAVEQALSLWEERERSRAKILAAVSFAEASLARGELDGIWLHIARDRGSMIVPAG